jgi:diguanylate cyclase (GGDEF)-like protein
MHPHSSPVVAGLQTRLVVETLVQVVPGTEIVAIVAASESIVGVDLESWAAPGSEEALAHIRKRVHQHLDSGTSLSSFSCVVSGVAWGVLVEPIEVHEGGKVSGALVVARQGRAWSSRERALAKAFGGQLSHSAALSARESNLLHRQRLDELVSQVAERLMSASTRNRQEILSWTTRVLGEFLGSDTAFLRRNDHARGMSVMVAEWPVRENVPDPDPLGEVPFDADPIFARTRDLRGPFLSGVVETPDVYLERVEQGSGVADVDGAAVPLLLADATWGVLGFLHFGRHAWTKAEINALQAVASMLVQLQARLDAEERTEYIAHHDDLTGLPNRRALLRELEDRLAAHRETAILFFDLDRFKVMNDFLGHASGDRVLTTIADRIRTSIRSNDFAARLGGDEFVILVDEAISELEVLSSAHRILEVVGRPINFSGQQVSHTASIGIVLSKPGSENGMELLGWADVALYAAKRQGRNRAVVFDEVLRDAVSERSRMELTLREAIDSDGLRLHFQPEVDLRTGRLLAVEALVRWDHPTRGLLPASSFIVVAEETALVVDMGRWVFEEACRQLAIWRRDYPNLPIVVRVNMSPAQFVTNGLVEFVEDCLRQHRIPGRQLCIEITEHAVLQEPDQTARMLRGFQALGVEVALDDFGTGFASMTELKRLPVNLLKLDTSFVQGITTDASDRAIVEAIIQLGYALNLGVIAEGIESSATIDKLLELGCHRGQGYLIAVPMAADDLAPILRAGAVSMSALHATGSTDAGLVDWVN